MQQFSSTKMNFKMSFVPSLLFCLGLSVFKLRNNTPVAVMDSPYGTIIQKWLTWTQDWHTWWRHQMKHFRRHWPFVMGIHRSPVDSPHKGQCHGTAISSLIRAWTNGWANTRDAGDWRRHQAYYDVTVVFEKRGTMFSLWHSQVMCFGINIKNKVDITTILVCNAIPCHLFI